MFKRVNALLATGQVVRIVAYGDSISNAGKRPDYHGGATRFEMNWAQQLKAMLARAYPHGEFVVENFGVGGQNAYEGLGRYEWLGPFKPDMVILEFGANDCFWHPIPPECTAHAIKTLVLGIGLDYQADVVVMGPGGDCPHAKIMFHLEETNEALRKVAQETGVPFVDIRAAIMTATYDGKMWTDFHNGLTDCHPNDKGHTVWAQAVMNVIEENTP